MRTVHHDVHIKLYCMNVRTYSHATQLYYHKPFFKDYLFHARYQVPKQICTTARTETTTKSTGGPKKYRGKINHFNSDVYKALVVKVLVYLECERNPILIFLGGR
jgi:hypothetical protein